MTRPRLSPVLLHPTQGSLKAFLPLFAVFTSALLLVQSFSFPAIAQDTPEIPQEVQQAWILKNRDFFKEILTLRDEALREVGTLLQEGSEEQVRKLIDQDEVHVERDGFGKAEVTTIDDALAVRVVHYETELSFLIYNDGEIAENSEHLRMYEARQHRLAGKSRRDGQVGRDLIKIALTKVQVHSELGPAEEITRTLEIDQTMNQAGPVLPIENAITNVDYSPRPKAFKEKAKDYFYSYFKKSSRDDALFGLIIGAGLQTVVSGGIAAAAYFFLGDQFIWQHAALSAVYGSVIGTNASTYRNWVKDGSRFQQTLKHTAISGSYRYVFLWMTEGFVAAAQMFVPSSTMLHISSNMVLSNWAKSEAHQINYLRDQKGINRGNITFRLPFFGEVNWKRPNLENQLLYLLPHSFSALDLIVRTTVMLPFIGETSASKLALFTSSFAFLWVAKEYSKKLDPEGKLPLSQELQERWNRLKRPHLWPKMLWDKLKGIYEGVKNSCESLLTRRQDGQAAETSGQTSGNSGTSPAQQNAERFLSDLLSTPQAL